MNIYAAVAVTIAVSYLFGCCNSALIISKYLLHDDVRQHGSGNAGLTNFYRVFGKKKVAMVILFDMLKTVFATLLGCQLFTMAGADPVVGKLVGGIACMLGHSFPVMFGFKGGKGVLCGGTLILMLDWRIALICLGIFVILVGSTKMISLGSMVAAILLPIVSWTIYHSVPVVLLCCVASVLVVWRHKDNAKRIVEGKENKFEFKKE